MPKASANKGTSLTPKETLLLSASLNALPTDMSKAINFEKVAAECGYKDAGTARTMFQRLRRGKMTGKSDGDKADASKGAKKTKAPAKRKLVKAADDDDAWEPTNKRAKTNTRAKRTKKAMLSEANAAEAEKELEAMEAAAENIQNPVASDTGSATAVDEGQAKPDSTGHEKEGNAGQEVKANPGEKVDAGEKMVVDSGETVDAGEKAAVNPAEKTEAGETVAANKGEKTEAGDKVMTDAGNTIDAGEEVMANSGETIDAGEKVPANTGERTEAEEKVAASTGDKIDAGQEVVAASGEKIDASPTAGGDPGEKVVAGPEIEVEYTLEQPVAAILGQSIHAGPETNSNTGEIMATKQDVVPTVDTTHGTGEGHEVAAGGEEKVSGAQEIVVEQIETVQVETKQEVVGGPEEVVMEKKEEVVVSLGQKVEFGQDEGTIIDNQLYPSSDVVVDLPASIDPDVVMGDVEETAQPLPSNPPMAASEQADEGQH